MRAVRSSSIVSRLLAIAALMTAAVLTPAARADTIVAAFNLDSDGKSIPSHGDVFFTLNGDGTLAAYLDYWPTADAELRFSDGVNANVAASNFGSLFTGASFQGDGAGFFCDECDGNAWWTLGTPGEFTSVWQAFGDKATGNPPLYFYLNVGIQDGQYMAMVEPPPDPPVPEPGTLISLGAGLALLVAVLWYRAR